MNATELVERYIDTWNQADPGMRRSAVSRLWSEDAHYVDPVADVTATTASPT